MKKALMVIGFLLLGTAISFAGDKNNHSDEKDGIHWLTFEQAEQKMKTQPKKVLIDVYTSWCGWCKVMDKKTYTNPELIKYVNKNYYSIKFDAEQKKPINFKGKVWKYEPKYKVNALALDLLHGRLSYPTTVIMEEHFKTEQPIPGYLKVSVLEGILKFFGENVYLHKKWEDYQKSFKSTWSE